MFYLVYVWVDREIATDWLTWMCDVHVPDVVQTACFLDAFVVRDSEGDRDGRVAYRVLYRARSEAELERYQRDFAPALQAEHTERYEGRFEARRELLPIVHTVSASASHQGAGEPPRH